MSVTYESCNYVMNYQLRGIYLIQKALGERKEIT